MLLDSDVAEGWVKYINGYVANESRTIDWQNIPLDWGIPHNEVVETNKACAKSYKRLAV